MKVTSYDNAYGFCAVNIGYHLMDFSGDIVCYGSSASAVLYSLQQRKVVNILKGHANEVNSVRIFGADRQYIVSSSTDKSVIVWTKLDKSEHEYEIEHILKHSSSVSISDAIEHNGKIYTFTTTRDKMFRVWEDGQVALEQSYRGFTLDIKVYNNLQLFPGLMVVQANSEGKILFQRFDIEKKELQTLIAFTGHTDWIRTLDVHQNPTNGTLLIASGAQDFSTRVYSIQPLIQNDNDPSTNILHSSTFTDREINFTTECVTILYTHDLWVNSVKWFTTVDGVLSLLTASSDRTIVIWQEVDTEGELSSTKVWQELARFGEFGGVQMGFNGCVVDGQRSLIVGYNYLGAIEVWNKKETIVDWEQTMSITGHYGNVTDLVWEPKGEYFLTCSEDRTTRLHSKLKNDASWHEIARTQVHGHPLKCLSLAGPIKLISGAEEKVIRVFNATKYFIQSLKNISGIDLMANRTLNDSDMAEYATVPALGLSNSAVYQRSEDAPKPTIQGDVGGIVDIEDVEENVGENTDEQPSFVPKVLDQPPIEEALEQNTLWPEIRKLYGHGFEIFSMAVNTSGTLLASACRAQSLKHATIIVWSLNNYEILLKLGAHNLTITQLKFSPDDRFLLSVSRDRTWNLFNMNQASEQFGERVAFFNSKTGGHTRIIWDSAWVQDSKAFVTVARDNKAIVWNVNEDMSVQAHGQVLALTDPITTVDILNSSQSSFKNFVAAFGLENGRIELYEFSHDDGWNLLSSLERSWHTATVNRVRFSPKTTEVEGRLVGVSLASCGVDKAVKLIDIKFE